HHSGGLPYSPPVWISGDLHLENFGSFKGDNRQVYFDLNDFDESLLAPAAWELARMLTSIFVAFRSLGIEEKRAEKTARLFITTYARQLQNGKPTYIEPNTAEGIVHDLLTAVDKRKQRWLLEKSTVSKKNKGERLLRDPRHRSLPPALQEALFEHINQWLQQDNQGPHPYKRHYKAIDGVSRQAGTGSLGLYRYVVLLKSVEDNREKYRMIDIKQCTASSLAPYVQHPQPAWPTEAHRIVHIQQRMQNRPPALLGTTVFRDQPYIIQEMQPEKDSVNLALLRDRYRDMCHVVEDMAVLTASAQLRSSGRQGSAIADELIDYGHAPQWQEAIFEYA
ncbi:MAG TPA: DUF2252 family protein, partial [Chitinophagaceae bacterium]|nr:DUF2252 family protein [Chitinophagaceae bacterium]